MRAEFVGQGPSLLVHCYRKIKSYNIIRLNLFRLLNSGEIIVSRFYVFVRLTTKELVVGIRPILEEESTSSKFIVYIHYAC